MKAISFYQSLDFQLRRDEKTLKSICNCPVLALSSTYSGVLGLVGVVLSCLDIIRIIKAGSILPCSLLRARIRPGKIVSPECERDLRLISLVLSFEYYCLLLFGTFTDNPLSLIPWLVLYFFLISVEFLIFVLKIFTDGLTLQKQSLLMSMFVVFNWLSIFCNFSRLVRA